jgi:hypothetical protein
VAITSLVVKLDDKGELMLGSDVRSQTAPDNKIISDSLSNIASNTILLNGRKPIFTLKSMKILGSVREGLLAYVNCVATVELLQKLGKSPVKGGFQRWINGDITKLRVFAEECG